MVYPCVACDRPVLVRPDVWAGLKSPMAVCGECGDIQNGVLHQLFQLRGQVRHLHDALKAVKNDVTELYESYKDLTDS